MTPLTAQPKSVVLFGATGTIGHATAQVMVEHGHKVVCVVRPGADRSNLPSGATILERSLDNPETLDLAGVDAVVSCLASRTGAPTDAWAIDHDAHLRILSAAEEAGVGQFVLLSAICVQKPKLEFQRAKLAFEEKLIESPLIHSIVRPTAYFKSLSGQVQRVKDGRPFLVFGDGTLTACAPISDADLGRFMALCLVDDDKKNQVLPIGGPGPALTPIDQGRLIFDALGQEPQFRHVPVALMDGIIGVLQLGGLFSKRLRAKAELAKIGRYYATESMLVWDGAAYDAAATPSFGSETLDAHYRALLAGDVSVDLGDHAVF